MLHVGRAQAWNGRRGLLTTPNFIISRAKHQHTVKAAFSAALCCAVLCCPRRIFLRSWYVAEAVRRMRSVRKGQVWGWPSRLVYLWRGLRSFEAAADVVMALMGKQACINPTEEEDSRT